METLACLWHIQICFPRLLSISNTLKSGRNGDLGCLWHIHIGLHRPLSVHRLSLTFRLVFTDLCQYLGCLWHIQVCLRRLVSISGTLKSRENGDLGCLWHIQICLHRLLSISGTLKSIQWEWRPQLCLTQWNSSSQTSVSILHTKKQGEPHRLTSIATRSMKISNVPQTHLFILVLKIVL